MATAARLAISVRRYEVARFTIVVTGIDLTGVPMALQVRLRPDTPGAPQIALSTVNTLSAEGLKLDSVTIAGGVPTSVIKGRINASTMNDPDKVPYMGEIGEDALFAYAMQWTISGDAQTRLYGDFIVQASAFGSDSAPANRPESYGVARTFAGSSGGSLTFGDQVISVAIDGAAELRPLLNQASQSAASSIISQEIATEAATTASLAAAAAVVDGNLHDSVATGMAATPDGEFFLVRATGDRFADLYLRNGSDAELQPNQLPSAEAIAQNLGPIRPFAGNYMQPTLQPGQVHLSGETSNGTSLMHFDFMLLPNAAAYSLHALVTALEGVTLGGGIGIAVSGPGYGDSGVFNRYTNGPGSSVRANRVGGGDGWGALLSFSSTGFGGGLRAVKQNANGQPGGPCGIGPGILAENLSDEGTAITSVTAPNNKSPISNILERQNTTGGVITRSQMLMGGPRTTQLTGQDVYLTPGTPSIGPSPVQGFAVQIGDNIIGSAEATGVSVSNNATGGASAFGGVYSVTGDNDVNTGLLAQAIGGTINRAATLVGEVVIGGNVVLNTDNAFLFGSPGARIKEIFCVTGTINTSDERQKKWLGGLTAAHLRAAKRIEAVIGCYQWLEQIAEKGESGARIHFGVKAQEVVEIFYSENLEQRPLEGERPSFRHAFLCYDTWDDINEDVMVPGKVVKRFEVPVMTGKRLFSAPKPYATGEVEYRIDPSTGQTATEPTPVIAFEEDTVGVPEVVFEEVEREVDGLVKDGERIVRPAGDQYGLRLGQLALFLAGANAARLSAMEEQLARLDQAA